MFKTQFNSKDYPKVYPDFSKDIDIVERAGYVKPKKVIEDFLKAGIKLKMARMEFYDYPNGEIDLSDLPAITRKDIDLAEATQILEETNRRINQAIRDDIEKSKLNTSKVEETVEETTE